MIDENYSIVQWFAEVRATARNHSSSESQTNSGGRDDASESSRAKSNVECSLRSKANALRTTHTDIFRRPKSIENRPRHLQEQATREFPQHGSAIESRKARSVPSVGVGRAGGEGEGGEGAEGAAAAQSCVDCA